MSDVDLSLEVGLTLQNEKLTEVDRLTLENEALRKCVQRLASLRDKNPQVMQTVHQCRHVLQVASRQRKALKKRDEVEVTCFLIIDHAARAQLLNPTIVLQRYGKSDWEALIEGFEDDENVGVGMGRSPVLAVRDLLGKVKIYEARCKRGVLGHTV